MFVVAFLTFMANGGFPSVVEDMKGSLLLLQCDYWVYNMKDGKEIWSLTLAINSLNFGNYINFLEKLQPFGLLQMYLSCRYLRKNIRYFQ